MLHKTIAHYTRLLRLWPTDRLRPEERHFQRLIQTRIQHPPPSDTQVSHEANAGYLLLDNAFTKRYPLSHRMMQPQSDPAFYERLGREIDEAPDRSFFQRMAKKLKGMVRLR